MAGKRVISPTPVCEKCWLETHSRWEPQSVGQDGNVLMKLVGVSVPHKLNTGSVEVCAECGGITIAGIFDIRHEERELLSYGEEVHSDAYDYGYEEYDDEEDDE